MEKNFGSLSLMENIETKRQTVAILNFIGLILEDDEFPKMIELFCRSDFKLKNAKGITPIADSLMRK